MPIIKSAKKRVRQSEKRQARNYNVRTAIRKTTRTVLDACEKGDSATASKELPKAYKAIDTATKKHVLQKNTAARRKSLLARRIGAISKKA
ncbi:MAG: 30S ribosomal protein S20 [Candidatus Gracilibacteria bacterium]|jgi:small subunit ribosomal protein S20